MDSAAAAPVPYIRTRLFIMMLLEFFIWGSWLPLIFTYLPSLGFSPEWQQPLILSAFPVASIVGMFFSNQFADRRFAGEKFLAFSHLVGGLAILGLGFTRLFWPFFALMLVHCLLYVPTISITNSIAFANLKDPQKEFGIVRMGGTIGWILAAWPFYFILKGAQEDATRWTYIVAGLGSLLLSAFSLTLPHTPPKKATGGAVEKFAWLESLKLLRHPYILILWLIAFVDSFVHNCYFSWTSTFLETKVNGPNIAKHWIMPVMSLSQISEILTMAMLGFVLKNLGWRGTMVIGILGHAARFAVYSLLPQETWLIILIQAIHGICYAFFFATVYIFVDAVFPKDVRSSAQGLFNVMILGVGALAAFFICPRLAQKVFFNGKDTDFRSLFMIPCLTALAAAVVLALFFRPPKAAQEPAPSAVQAEGGSA
jgi:nucleoside transporter